MDETPLLTPKQKRGLLIASIAASLVGLAIFIGLIAMYVNNFNILRWAE